MSETLPPAASHTLQRIEREFERIGLLLQHDAELPSFTTLVAGEPIAGSWWSHPLAHPIYELLQTFTARSGGLHTKLIDGKVTHVHRRLWPAFLVRVQHLDPARVHRLSPAAQALHERLREQPILRTDELRRSGFADSKQITKAIRELELRLLIHTDDVHTDSGAHAKVLMTWATWADGRRIAPPELSLAEASAQLDEAVQALCHDARRRPKLPW
jgi:hypothetical protein